MTNYSFQNAKSCGNDPNGNLPGVEFQIKTTWNNLSLTHSPITFSLKWNEYNKAINVKYSVSNIPWLDFTITLESTPT